MIVLTIDQIQKSYGSNLILDRLSAEIWEGDRIGIIGRNGCGKTTLFKILAGIESVDQGGIYIKKGSRVGYLEQSPSIEGSFSGEEVLRLAFEALYQLEKEISDLTQAIESHANLGNSDKTVLNRLLETLDGLQKQFELKGGYEIEIKINRVIEGLQLGEGILTSKFATLSGGEKTRLMLGKILLEAPDILLLDEPTNHLDLAALNWLERYLENYKGTVLMVSHDRAFLDQTATKILEIEDKQCRIWKGNYSTYKADRDAWLLSQVEVYRQQQKKVRAMEEAIKRFEDWGRRADNQAMFAKARNMEKRLEKMEKIDRPQTKEKGMGLSFEADGRTGNKVFTLEGVSAGYDEKNLFTEVDLQIQYRDAAVLMGANGVGKSTVFKLLTGSLLASKGVVKIGSNVKLGYLEQEVYFEKEERSILTYFNEETLIGAFQARGKLAKFLFFTEDLDKKLSQLSGGERVRLKLCLMMEQGINVLLLDEPTNHMDIVSREILETALEHFTGTLLMISHDRYFIKRLAKQYYLLKPTGIIQLEGFEDVSLLEKMVSLEESRLSDKEVSFRSTVDRRLQNELRRSRQRIEIIEPLLFEKEMELAQCNEAIASGDIDFQKLMTLCEVQKHLKEEVEAISQEWLALSDFLERYEGTSKSHI